MAIAIERRASSLRLVPALCLTMLLAACAGQQAQQGPLTPSAQTATKPASTAPTTGPTTGKAPTPGKTVSSKAQEKPTPAGSRGAHGATVASADVQPEAATSADVLARTHVHLDRMVEHYVVKKGDDLLEIARNHDLGFLELRAANPGVDTWLPKVGSTIILPTKRLVAKTLDHGILINLAEMRLYRFEDSKVVESHPLGIGRDGLETPTGSTTIIRKTKNPSWYPTARMRRENPALPKVVGPGPQNPLGNRALYLGWALYRIHGTNIPWGVGRRVSSGCMRMYPEDVTRFYDNVPVGSPVTVVKQRLVAQMIDGRLWVEVYPTSEGWDALETHSPEPEMPMTTKMVADLTRVVPEGMVIDWKKVDEAVRDHRGYPVAVSP